MKQENLKLFKLGWLEKLTLTPVWLPASFWLPILFWLVYKSLQFNPLTEIILGFSWGIFVWSLTEYLLHRFIFHYQAKSSFGKKVVFILHDNHHQIADDPLRGLFPIMPAAVIGYLYFFGFKLLWGVELSFPMTAGFVFGYLTYDYLHFSFHHYNFSWNWWKSLRAKHLRHHTRENHGYGVSNPFWDIVLGTKK